MFDEHLDMPSRSVIGVVKMYIRVNRWPNYVAGNSLYLIPPTPHQGQGQPDSDYTGSTVIG